MSVEVKWLPSPESDVSSYVVERATSVLGPWSVLATVENDSTSEAYDPVTGLFSAPDPDGSELIWYRLKAVDTAGLVSDPSEPFRAVVTPPSYGSSQVRIDHNYPEPDRLRYVTDAGLGVDDAIVRVYRASDYDASVNAPPVATTITYAAGRWKDPIFLTPGYTYIVLYSREGQYGPDSVRIDV